MDVRNPEPLEDVALTCLPAHIRRKKVKVLSKYYQLVFSTGKRKRKKEEKKRRKSKFVDSKVTK